MLNDRLAAAARPFGIVAAVLLAAMMLLTVSDVVLRALFNRPILGAVDLVELLLTGVFFIALPAVFLRREQIVVDVISLLHLRRSLVFIERLAWFLSLCFLLLMLWRGYFPFVYMLESAEHTASIDLPRWIHWVPILFGMAASVVVHLVLIMIPGGVGELPPESGAGTGGDSAQ